ncbi:TetR/AcrR family transcriptional regulator [Aliiglaciecola sp. CAU 1673]|uniref:TetR/AcrR family transcriptional regulator n=1 Tax=Aliiglaciecola sp. CAU 1673 TaxID=3032595 RepID=UPI0023DBFF6B|nr:TetR/AcrR family transcriptional regulator [Aliiglaciecola sp. CAU 1673]MDF2177117.1 TetR/AcrR family transcriptional regulator [Aliiglaciecola sp. CAU 1673]
MAGKTAERILITSLELFNRHGEAGVTSVDIAMELDISPGNLYYHFKGKDVIVAALFDMYRQQLNRILTAPGESLDLEEFFYFLYLMLECSALFRFFYRNPSDLVEKYPELAKGLRALNKAKLDNIRRLLGDFQQSGQLALDSDDLPQLVELVGLILSQGPDYSLLMGQTLDNEQFIHQGLSHIYFLLKPHINTDKISLDGLQAAIAKAPHTQVSTLPWRTTA